MNKVFKLYFLLNSFNIWHKWKKQNGYYIIKVYLINEYHKPE